MAASLPDLVDCLRLAGDKAVLLRDYELKALSRLRDLLAEPEGVLRASFAFARLPNGRAGATVRIQVTPRLVCQRCLRGFGCRIDASTEIEFADDEQLSDADDERESVRSIDGQVSLMELAEEELLLALPVAPACDAPLECGNAPRAPDDEEAGSPGDMRRPFGALQDLMKKT